ncbi:PrgI family protein, partial [Candidatus Pacearchaeota archaeon]|nr:PrgI family protein [Candidatus Pacearchaeota archaeon]
MQYKIPQDVGIEDKIVGPLSLRQLIILAIGFGISYVLFALMSKLYELNALEYIVIAIPGLISAAFAMIKINDVPLIKYMFLFLEFSIKPKKRIWDHRGIANLVSPDLSGGISKTSVSQSDTSDKIAEKTKQASNLRELTHMLNSHDFDHVETPVHDDVDEAHDDDLVASAYFGNKKDETGNMYWRTKESHMEMLKVFAQLPTTQLKQGTKEAEIAKQEIEKVSKEVESMKNTKKQPAPQAISKPAATPAKKQEAVVEAPKKKTRKRSRPTPKPIRENNSVNTTTKKQPAQYIPKPTPKPKPEPTQPPAEPSVADQSKGG